MKTILLPFIFLVSSASAQTLECPSRSGTHKLADAKVYFDDKISEIQGDFLETKNGHDLILPLNVKYLVCNYNGNVNTLKEFTPKPDVKICRMEVRENGSVGKKIKLYCK